MKGIFSLLNYILYHKNQSFFLTKIYIYFFLVCRIFRRFSEYFYILHV